MRSARTSSSDRRRTGRDLSPFVVAARLAAGLALVGSLGVGWVSEGGGSTMTGRELAAAFRSLPLFADWGLRAALALYAVAALGIVALAASTSTRRAVSLALVAGSLPLLALLVVLIVRGTLPLSIWGAGPMLVAAALLVLTATSTWTVVTSDPTPT